MVAGLRAHIMPCQNYYDVMAFAIPGEGALGCRQDNRKVSHGDEDVVVIKEPAPQPGHAVNLRATPRGGNSEPYWRARKGPGL